MLQFTADLVTMNAADFIVTSTCVQLGAACCLLPACLLARWPPRTLKAC
jgi:hypothetical protein